MTDLSHLSKEAKEAYVSIKMEEIRRKNEELKKRHAEIEADKRNAEMNSSKAQSTQVKRVTQGIPPEKPTVVGRISSGRGKRLENLAKEQLKAPEYQQKKQQQRLNEDENPPPDPVFNFLYDRSREGKDTEDRFQRSRRHISNFGGQDFANVKNTMQIRKTQEKDNPPGPPRNKMEMALRMTGRERKEYENWRLEREKIEEDRLARQKTATGEWRREWDKNKLEQDDVEEQQRPQWQPRGRGRGGGGGGGRGHNYRGRGDHGHHGDMSRPPRWRERGQGQTQAPSRGGGSNYGGRRQSSSSQSESERSMTIEDSFPVDQDGDIDRKVLVDDHSLRISISNDGTAGTAGTAGTEKPPLTPRTSMTPPRRIGSGRVLSTSSQSEDERTDGRSNRRGKPYQRGQFSRERGSRAPVHDGPQRSSGKSGKYQKQRRADNEGILRPPAHQAPHSPLANADATPIPVEKLEEATVSSGTSEPKDEWETGGDESWEDVTTSGNESLELSGPTDDVQTVTISAELGSDEEGDDDEDDEDEDHFQNIEIHLENLSGSNLEPSRRIQHGAQKQVPAETIVPNASIPVSIKNKPEVVGNVADNTVNSVGEKKQLSGPTDDVCNTAMNIEDEYDDDDDDDDEEDDEDDYYGEEELRNLEARLENLSASSFVANIKSPQEVQSKLTLETPVNVMNPDSLSDLTLIDDKVSIGITQDQEGVMKSVTNSSSDVASLKALVSNESSPTNLESQTFLDTKAPEDVIKDKDECKEDAASSFSDAVDFEMPFPNECSSSSLKEETCTDIKASENVVNDKGERKDDTSHSLCDTVTFDPSFPSENNTVMIDDDATPALASKLHENEGSEANQKISEVTCIPTDDESQLTSDVYIDSSPEQKEPKKESSTTDAPCYSVATPLSEETDFDEKGKHAFEVSEIQNTQSTNLQDKQAQDTIATTEEIDALNKIIKNTVNQNECITSLTELHQETNDCNRSSPQSVTDDIDRTLCINTDTSQSEVATMEEKSIEDVSCLSKGNEQEGKKRNGNIDQSNNTLPEKPIE